MLRPDGEVSEAYVEPWEAVVEPGRAKLSGIDGGWYEIGIEDLETMVLQRDLSWEREASC